MDEVHKWSAERGHLMQFITGIPNFYRQFGYDMALSFVGRRTGYESNLPKLKEGESEPVNVRAVREDDLEFVLGLYEAWEKRYLIHVNARWMFCIIKSFGKRDGNINRFEKMILEDASGKTELVSLNTPLVYGWTVYPASILRLWKVFHF